MSNHSRSEHRADEALCRYGRKAGWAFLNKEFRPPKSGGAVHDLWKGSGESSPSRGGAGQAPCRWPCASVSLATSCFNRKLYAKSSTGKQIAHSAWLEGQLLAQTAFLSRDTSTSSRTHRCDLPLAMLDRWRKKLESQEQLQQVGAVFAAPVWVIFQVSH